MNFFLVLLLITISGCKTTSSEENNDTILKAETDDRSTEKTKKLVDISELLNEHINQIIDEARIATKPAAGWTPESTQTMLEYVFSKIGAYKPGSGIIAGVAGIGKEVSKIPEIAVWMKNTFDPAKNQILSLKFSETVYHENTVGILSGKVMSHKSLAAANHSIAPVVNVGGVILGSDKFGHFFQQGYWYFKANLPSLRARCEFGQYMEGNDVLFTEKWRKYRALAEAWQPGFRFGYFGAWSTGVVSYADGEANEQGFQFWTALSENPDTYKFDIRSIKDHLPLMNESINYNKFANGINVDFVRSAPRPQDTCFKFDPVRP